jgi:hypothetical protein
VLHVGEDGGQILLVDMDCVGGFINSESTDKKFPDTRYHGNRPAANVKLRTSTKYPGLFYFMSTVDIPAGTELFASYNNDDGKSHKESDDGVMLDNAVTSSQAALQQAAEREQDSDYEPS